jgi:hypothetical protein
MITSATSMLTRIVLLMAILTFLSSFKCREIRYLTFIQTIADTVFPIDEVLANGKVHMISNHADGVFSPFEGLVTMANIILNGVHGPSCVNAPKALLDLIDFFV